MNRTTPHTKPKSSCKADKLRHGGGFWKAPASKGVSQRYTLATYVLGEDIGCFYHLGSSSWISTATGNTNQHLAYMPYGEQFIDERKADDSRDIRFKFTAKEREKKLLPCQLPITQLIIDANP